MALETIEFDGKPYVPSKQAAEATGYTQDYIGQLARGTHILSRRIGGLWYVNMESLAQHKKAAEAYVPEPPARITDRSGSIVSFDGKEYISSRRAAEITRYTQDYIGQLARGGKIGSRQVSGRWYVSKDDLRAHKEEKDSLLRAVQAEAVGIERPVRAEEIDHKEETKLFTYLPTDEIEMPALPTMIPKQVRIQEEYVSRSDISVVEEESSSAVEDENATHHIAIRAMRRDVEAAQLTAPTQSRNEGAGYSKYRTTWSTSGHPVRRKGNVTGLIAVIITVLFILTGAYLYTSGVFQRIGSSFPTQNTEVTSLNGSESTYTNAYMEFVDSVIDLFGGTVTYTRK